MIDKDHLPDDSLEYNFRMVDVMHHSIYTQMNMKSGNTIHKQGELINYANLVMRR